MTTIEPTALTVLPYCDVCEEPTPAVIPSRYHGADVKLCPSCLEGELEVVADMPWLADERHTRDEDCTLDATDTCDVCGVWHGDPCPACGGRGYHRTGCPEIG